jgi:hypothetical protein
MVIYGADAYGPICACVQQLGRHDNKEVVMA